MALIGTIVVYIIMICAVAGAFAAIKDPDRGLGKEFMNGLHAVGHIFVPAAGIMASIPYLTWFIDRFVGPLFNFIGADPAIAATTILAPDMGGYQLADALKASYEGWVMALIVGFMAGATIVFSIPMGLAMLDKRDHKYMALGVMAGVLTIPIGALISSVLIVLFDTNVREIVSTTADSSYEFAIGYGQILINLAPLLIFVVIIAAGLKFFPNAMITGFMVFGRLMDAGQFAAEETVHVAGPKGSFARVRVLGPARKLTQVEVSQTDTVTLGVKAPVRESGDIQGSAAITLIGPMGSVHLNEGLIVAQAHIHMAPQDATRFGVSDQEYVSVQINSERPLTVQKVKVRVSERYRLEMHVDTDEANAALLSKQARGVLLKLGETPVVRHDPKPQVAKPLVYTKKLLTKEDLATFDGTEMHVAKGTLVTDLAKDFARERGIALSFETRK